MIVALGFFTTDSSSDASRGMFLYPPPMAVDLVRGVSYVQICTASIALTLLPS